MLGNLRSRIQLKKLSILFKYPIRDNIKYIEFHSLILSNMYEK